ncbi:hypothetical protein C1708_19030 [Streptomyces sp. DH-12]|nr:hypothetical protein C1708_19030 [Streptomyces sp. DH-12]
MRKIPAAVTATLTCLVTGAAVTGCSGDGAAESRSAGQLLDDANAAMNALTSVTVDMVTRTTEAGKLSARLTTDLKDTCTFTSSGPSGSRLEQIRIDGSDYVRPNRAYLEESGRQMSGAGEQGRWVKTPVSESEPGDGLAQCTYEFASFGEVDERSGPTEVDGTPATSVEVADGEDGSFTFHIAAEGKPYILKVVHKDGERVTTTSFSAFDEPLDVRPPDQAKVLDMTGIG